MKIASGTTRWVILTKKYAIKIPRPCSWRAFFWGMLANDMETKLTYLQDSRLCPVLFALPWGLLTVMPRCLPITDEQWAMLDPKDLETFCDGDESAWTLPIECKQSSFGWLNETIVAVDYGGPYWYNEDDSMIIFFINDTEQTLEKPG